MDKFVINGGRTLNGSVVIGGAKNATLALMPATILAAGPPGSSIHPHSATSTRWPSSCALWHRSGAEGTYADARHAQHRQIRSAVRTRKKNARLDLCAGSTAGTFRTGKVSLPGVCMGSAAGQPAHRGNAKTRQRDRAARRLHLRNGVTPSRCPHPFRCLERRCNRECSHGCRACPRLDADRECCHRTGNHPAR